MKLNQVITGCALAAGLMAVATFNAQATVVDGDLLASANLKGTISYDDNGKIKKATFTNKDILENLGLDDKGNKIAYNVDTEDVWVINKDNFVADLTDDYEAVYIYLYQYTYAEKENQNGNSGKWSASGYSDVYYYPYASIGSVNIDGIWITGPSTESGSWKYSNNNSKYSESYKYSAKNLGGYAWYDTGDGDEYYGATGSVSGSGNGKWDNL